MIPRSRQIYLNFSLTSLSIAFRFPSWPALVWCAPSRRQRSPRGQSQETTPTIESARKPRNANCDRRGAEPSSDETLRTILMGIHKFFEIRTRLRYRHEKFLKIGHHPARPNRRKPKCIAAARTLCVGTRSKALRARHFRFQINLVPSNQDIASLTDQP